MQHQLRPRTSSAIKAAPDQDKSIQDLRLELAVALKEEDYSLAARLRDTMQQMQVVDKLAVEDANRSFYTAFMAGSVQQMAEVWGEGDHVQVIHPGSNVIAGKEAVMDSWKAILSGVRPRAFKIELEDVRIYATDGFGYVTCTEIVNADDAAGRVVATNIFEKQEGRWRMTMHQGGAAPKPMRRR